MSKQKVYFARPVSQMGTSQDLRDLETISKLGFEIVDPQHVPVSEYKEKGMSVFTQIISDKADLLIFRGLPFGKITQGVVKEIAAAKEKGIPVIELPSFVDRELSLENTRTYLEEVGFR